MVVLSPQIMHTLYPKFIKENTSLSDILAQVITKVCNYISLLDLRAAVFKKFCRNLRQVSQFIYKGLFLIKVFKFMQVEALCNSRITIFNFTILSSVRLY